MPQLAIAAATPAAVSISRRESIRMYFRRPHRVPAMCRSRAATSINAERPSGNAPTTRVRRRISFMIRSSGLFVRKLRQCFGGYFMYVSVSA